MKNLDDEESPAAAYGIILGPLQAHRLERIQVAREGIKEASRVARAEW